MSDLVLADRVRSILGPLEKRLDLPHVHVMVQDHTVLLHGDVDTVQHKSAIERAVAGISGVEAVQSHLQLGLLHSDTRPSEGTRHQRPSPARTKLILAVEAAGVGESDAPRAVHAVTQVLRQRLPEEIWDHLLRHLPSDVQDLVEPAPVETAATARKVRTVPDFVSEVCAADGVPPAVALNVTTAVLGALKELVPEEVAGVGAVLPEELRHLWQAAGV